MKRSFSPSSFSSYSIDWKKIHIKWNEDRKLTWDDFKAAPLKMGSTAAMTTTHLGFSYSVANGKITYKIDCQFEKNKSWGLVKNDWILKHEQGHFDIAEIFARKLNKSLTNTNLIKLHFKKILMLFINLLLKKKKNFNNNTMMKQTTAAIKQNRKNGLKKLNLN